VGDVYRQRARVFIGSVQIRIICKKSSCWLYDLQTPKASTHSLISPLPFSTTMNFDKKDEDNEAVFHLDKTQVFQEARLFNASPIQPKKCRILLTKIKRILS
jgi:hypothetical protein